MSKKDPVTGWVVRAVNHRAWMWLAEHHLPHLRTDMEMKNSIVDHGICMAPWLDSAESGRCSGRLTYDHVKDEPMMGKRAPSDPAHLVSLCWHHHLDGWATSNRPALRQYLYEVNE